MAPKKQKSLLSSKKSKEPQNPTTENDFLEVADELEASAGKWKAGDADRALRFYQKAIAAYDNGLAKFPKSFDLSYNKALLLYNLSQDKRISSKLGSPIDMLKEALEAHRYALRVDQENPDLLFNAAQVLTSFAEELNDAADDDFDTKAQAVSLLQEAVEFFNTCLSRQEHEYGEMQDFLDQTAEQPAEDVPVESEDDNSPAEVDSGAEEWATVKEPVTPSTLIETALAQIGCLSSLATIVAPTSDTLLKSITEIARPLAQQKIPSYISLLPTMAINEDEPEAAPFLSVSATNSTFHATNTPEGTNPQAAAKAEADLAIAVFTAAIVGSEYRSQLCSLEVYYQRITEAFQSLSQNTSQYPESSHVPILTAYAEVLIEFVDNVGEMDIVHPEPDSITYRWQALESAQSQLTQATNKLPNAASDFLSTNKAQVYFTRANVELSRWMLSSSSKAHASSANVLLKNAGVYYRGAAGLAKQDRNQELEFDAQFRNHVAKAIEEEQAGEISSTTKAFLAQCGLEAVTSGLSEMVDEGLILESVKIGLQSL